MKSMECPRGQCLDLVAIHITVQNITELEHKCNSGRHLFPGMHWLVTIKMLEITNIKFEESAF